MLNENSSSKQTYKIDLVWEKIPKVDKHFLDKIKSDPCGFARALSMIVSFGELVYSFGIRGKSDGTFQRRWKKIRTSK